jgi:hypothetical protein
MKAELKRLHSPDADDLRSFVPPDLERFVVLVQAMIGPADDDSSESFDIVVCSVEWVRQQAAKGPVVGLHHLIVASFDYEAIAGAVRRFCEKCEGANWQEVAAKVSRLGRWEFDDYRE